MKLLTILLLVLSLVAGYITALLVPEEMHDGKKWFWLALALFIVITVVFLITSGLSTQSICAFAGVLFICGTIVRAHKR